MLAPGRVTDRARASAARPGNGRQRKDGRGIFSLARALGQRLPVALAARLSVCIGAVIGLGGAIGQRLDHRPEPPGCAGRVPGLAAARKPWTSSTMCRPLPLQSWPLLRCVTPLAGTPTPEGGHADPDLRSRLHFCTATSARRFGNLSCLPLVGRTWIFTWLRRVWFDARVGVGSVLSCCGNDAASSRRLSRPLIARHLIMSRRMLPTGRMVLVGRAWFGIGFRTVRVPGQAGQAVGHIVPASRGDGAWELVLQPRPAQARGRRETEAAPGRLPEL
jgi:hypothetical protein